MSPRFLLAPAFLGVVGFIPSARAGDPIEDLLSTRSLSGDSKAWYGIFLSGTPVGVASAATQNDDTPPGATEFDARILFRVGATPIVLQLSSAASGKENEQKIKVTSSYSLRKETFGEQSTEWNLSPQRVESQGATVSLAEHLFGTLSKSSATSLPWNSGSTFIGFRPKKLDTNAMRFFSPFSGEFFAAKDIATKFDEDGWASTFTIPSPDAVNVEFLRKTKSEADNLRAEIAKNAVDPLWFSSEQSLARDVQKLKGTIDNCIQSGEATEKDIKRKGPGVPYLLHRKLVNTEALCQRAKLSISKWEAEKQSSDKLFTSLAQDLKGIEKESRREVPRTLATTPEISTLTNAAIQWQNVRVMDYLIRKTQSEMSLLFSIDQERKVNTELRISTKELSPRAILRTTIRAKDAVLRTSLEFASNRPIEDLSRKNSLLDGKKFAVSNDPSAIIASTCKNATGLVTLDLSNNDYSIIRSDLVRGVWDSATKAQVISEFLNRLAALPECTHSGIRISNAMEKEARNVIELFRHDVLQTENELQVSNGRPVKLKLFPGTYEISLSSFVTGKLIGKKDFTVNSSTKKNPAIIPLNFQ
jgi:hypothetical protein